MCVLGVRGIAYRLVQTQDSERRPQRVQNNRSFDEVSHAGRMHDGGCLTKVYHSEEYFAAKWVMSSSNRL